MNWNLVVIILLFLAVFFLITLSLLFYVRHWASRHIENGLVTENEGVYFKRYIPEQLRSNYDKKLSGIKTDNGIKHRAIWAKLAAVTIIFFAVALSGSSLIRNMDIFLLPVDLESHEIIRLDGTHHQWQRMVDEDLPGLSAVLASTKTKKFIVPYSEGDTGWLFGGVNLRQVAFSHWDRFARRNEFIILSCKWKNLPKCLAAHDDEIVLVLPGHWDFKSLDLALANGANVIAYGPPAQLFSDAKDKVIQWQGLTFEEVFKSEGGALILRGDQLLTLGFDAGLILKAYSPFKGFRVISKLPQAVSIGYAFNAGGENETRLFAKTTGSGRFVWMDFPPDPIYNGPEVNINHLDALMASIFRYLSRQTYSAIAMWPHAKKFAALIEEDTEDQYENAEAVIELVQRKNYPITWFVLSNEALKYRRLTRDMSEVGEIACHGDNHGVFTKSSQREQLIRIARCQKVLTKITGTKPLAFRPPQEEYNAFTMDAIVNNEMTHYIANNSPDRSVPEIQVSLANGKSLVSIPRMVSDDFEMWYTRKLNKADSINLIDDEINWMSHIGGLYMYSFHTQYMDDRDHLAVIEYMGDTLKQLDTYFATSKDIADWWHYRTDLQRHKKETTKQFSRFNPVLLSVNEEGSLIRTPYEVNKN